MMSSRKYSSPQIEFISMQAEGIIAGSKTLRVDNEKVIDNTNQIFTRNLDEPSSSFWESETDSEY